MEEWQMRIVEEYSQLKERYEKLRAFNNKREVESYLSDLREPHTKEEKIEARKEYHRTELLRAQQKNMEDYLRLLELRAELEGIDLVKRF
jgi:hypothetical protein